KQREILLMPDAVASLLEQTQPLTGVVLGKSHLSPLLAQSRLPIFPLPQIDVVIPMMVPSVRHNDDPVDPVHDNQIGRRLCEFHALKLALSITWVMSASVK